MPAYPNTSPTLLSKLRDPENNPQWQSAWKTFVLVYGPAIRASTLSAFRRCNVPIPVDEALVEDVVATVITEFLHKNPTLKGKLRGLLSTMARNKVIDLIRKRKDSQHPSLDSKNAEYTETDISTSINQQGLAQWEELERQTYHRALCAALISEVRDRVSARKFRIFDEVCLQGRDRNEVAKELGVSRHVIDTTVYKVRAIMREIAQEPDYRNEILL